MSPISNLRGWLRNLAARMPECLLDANLGDVSLDLAVVSKIGFRLPLQPFDIIMERRRPTLFRVKAAQLLAAFADVISQGLHKFTTYLCFVLEFNLFKHPICPSGPLA